MAKYTGRSGVFRIGSAPPAPVTYVDVAQVAAIGSVSITGDEVEVTTLDNVSGFREYLQTFKDAGELPITLVWDPSLATHGDAVGGLWDLFTKGEIRPFQIEFPIKPTAYVANFNGFVKAFPTPAMTPDDALTAEVSIRVSGTVDLVVKPATLQTEGPPQPIMEGYARQQYDQYGRPIPPQAQQPVQPGRGD